MEKRRVFKLGDRVFLVIVLIVLLLCVISAFVWIMYESVEFNNNIGELKSQVTCESIGSFYRRCLDVGGVEGYCADEKIKIGYYIGCNGLGNGMEVVENE